LQLRCNWGRRVEGTQLCSCVATGVDGLRVLNFAVALQLLVDGLKELWTRLSGLLWVLNFAVALQLLE
jgi:hypothetical protein